MDDSSSTLQLPEPDQGSAPPLGVTPPVEGLDRIRTVEFALVETRSFEFYKEDNRLMRVNFNNFILTTACIRVYI